MGQSVLSEPLTREAGILRCEDVPLPELAAAVGTPTYVYSSAAIREQYRALDTALAPIAHRIHYSVKANGNLAILRLLQSLGAGVDIVSGGELFRARLAGFVGRDVVFSGVGKSAPEIAQALDAHVQLINVESETELGVIAAEAATRGIVAPIAIRVNPEVSVSTPHAYTRTGERGNKFGIAYDDALRAARRARGLGSLCLAGLDMHLGSQIAGLDPYAAGLDRLLALHAALVADGFHDIRYLDVGGGLAVEYDRETPTDIATYAAMLVRLVGPTGLTLLLEPGRFLVGNAGILLTRVLDRKETGGKTYIVADAGMNDLLRPSHYDAYHRIEPVAAPTGRARSTVDVVGPVCETGDFFARGRDLPDVGPGDLLAIHSAGAYGYAMASNYNARPRPAEVLVDGRQYAIATVRETYDDLVRREQSTLAWREA